MAGALLLASAAAAMVGHGPAATAELSEAVGRARHVAVVSHTRFNLVMLTTLLNRPLSRCSELRQRNTCVNVLDFAPDGSCTPVAVDLQEHMQA